VPRPFGVCTPYDRALTVTWWQSRRASAVKHERVFDKPSPYPHLTERRVHCAVRRRSSVAWPPLRRSLSQTSAKKGRPRFIVADVRCPQIFNLLCMRDGVRHAPAVDAIGSVGEPGRSQFWAEAFKLGDEGVNVELGHGDEGTRGERESGASEVDCMSHALCTHLSYLTK
jgi:hypothetical protein